METDPVSTWAKLDAAQLAIAMIITGLADIRRRRWKDMPPPDGVTDDLWRAFLDYRKSRRQTLTHGAYRLLVGRLEKFTCDEWPPGRIVETIIERGWLTFEPDWLTRRTDRRNGNRDQHHEQGELLNPMAAAAARSLARHAGSG